ncbi:hypothetical protein GCM10023171_30000 [Microbacterium panaciterrae]|uniref:ANTAR domain-containing protein n=1 Tax=Microbacterium panaciterrae TaxID=985759 RepID=A0ABP8PPH6_9MICO
MACIVTHRHGICNSNVDMDAAFQLIRARARNTRTRLSEVARYIVEHPLDTAGEPPSSRL